MSDLITLFNSTRRRKVTKDNYIAPAYMRDKVIYCREYPKGVYINRSGRVDESKVVHEQEDNDDMDISDSDEDDQMSEDDEESEWEVCTFDKQEISSDEENDNTLEEENEKELKDLMTCSRLMIERTNIEKKLAMENTKRQEFVDYCEHLVADLERHFSHVIMKSSQDVTKNDIKIFDSQRNEIHELTVVLTGNFCIRVRSNTNGERIHDIDNENIITYVYDDMPADVEEEDDE